MTSQTVHRLVVVNGLNLGEDYILQDLHCTIGRASDNIIVIDSPSISRHHARIVLTLNGPQVEDLNSTNGTFVNGAEITHPVVLRPGDALMLADATTMRYELEAEEAVTDYMGAGNFGGATVIDSPATPIDPFAAPDYPPPAMEYSPPETPAQSSPAYNEIRFDNPEPVYVPPVSPAQGSVSNIADEGKPKRPTWVYIVIALLVILICVCVGVAYYLWTAPVEFYEQLFELFGWPLPEMLVSL